MTLTQTLKQSIIMENKMNASYELFRKCMNLLNERIATMEAHFATDPSMYSYEDWEDFIECAKFLNEHGGKGYDIIHVEQYMQTL